MIFLGRFLISLACCAIAYLALVVLVDAHGDFHTGLFPVIIQDSREQKMALFRQASAQGINGIILGSSRSMKLRPDELRRLTGQRFFNFAVDNAKTEDYLAIYRWVRAQGVHPKCIIIGLDIEAMHNDDIPDTRLVRNAVLYREVTGTRPWIPQLDASEQVLTRCKQTFTNTYLADTLKSVRLRLRHADSKPISGFEADGYLRYYRWEWEKAHGTFNLKAELTQSTAEYSRRLHGMRALSSTRERYLETLLSEARADGASIVIWLTNLHPQVTGQLAQTTDYPLLLRATQAYLRKLRNTRQIRAQDYHDPRNYGGSLTDWYDGAHIGETNARLVVEGLVKGKLCTWSSTPISSCSSSSLPSYRSSGSPKRSNNATSSSP
ncbi:MAG TPA: hypothetical protein VGL77_06845 [Armatimonadota bacterium]|jgi:hypothetical protein